MKFSKILKEEMSVIIKLFMSPIISVLLVTYVYSNVFIGNIPFGICDLDNSSLSRSITSQLQNHPYLDISYYAENEDDLKQAIHDKKVNAGIIIPKDFSYDMSMKKSPNALIIADNSNMLIGGNALGDAAAVVGTLNAGIQMKMLQGNNMYDTTVKNTMGTFTYTEHILYEPQGGYSRNLAYTIVPLIVQMVFMLNFSLPLLNKKKKELKGISFKSKEFLKNIVEIAIRVFIVSTAGVMSSFTALFIAKKMYCLPLRGDLMIYAFLMYAFILSITAVSFFVASFVDKISYFAQGYIMFNTAFTLVSGVSYPFFMMPQTLVKLIKMVIPISHVAVPLKVLNLKGVGWDVVLSYMNGWPAFTVTWFIIGSCLYFGRILYEKKKDMHKEKEKLIEGAV